MERLCINCKRYAPADRDDAAEFHADLAILIDTVYRHASRDTNEMLGRAFAMMPPMFLSKASQPGGSAEIKVTGHTDPAMIKTYSRG